MEQKYSNLEERFLFVKSLKRMLVGSRIWERICPEPNPAKTPEKATPRTINNSHRAGVKGLVAALSVVSAAAL
jgi:hypothetical protein